MEENAKQSRFLKVELSNYTSPVYLDSSQKNWVSWGTYNEYPYFLKVLKNMHPEHSAVLKGKASYVYGKGLAIDAEGSLLDSAKKELFLKSANRYQTWDEVFKATAPNYEDYNGFAWQIVWTNSGQRFEVFNIELGNLRALKDGKKVAYCKEWMIEENGKFVPNAYPEKDSSYKEFDLFNPNIRTGTQIFIFRKDVNNLVPYGEMYPIPVYNGAIMEIETDIEISKLHYHHMKNGMFASSLLSFFNGEPDAKEKKAIKKMFDRTYGGTENGGTVIFSFNDKGGTAPDLKTLTQSDLDKQFELVSKRNQDKIFSAHLTAPILFGIKTEGSLSDTSGQAIMKEWDKFVRTYIEHRQNDILDQIKYLADVQGFDMDGLYVKQTQPVGLDFTNPNISKFLSVDEVRLGLGLDAITTTDNASSKVNDALNSMSPLVATKVLEVMTEDEIRALASLRPKNSLTDGEGNIIVTQTPQITVNENLKKLSGRDWQHIKRLVREVQNGKTRREVASMMLKNGYALNDADIDVLLQSQNFSSFKFNEQKSEDYVLSLFEAYAIDDNDDEIVSEEFIFKKRNFLTEKEASDFILEALKGNPLATPESLAKQLQIGVDEVLVILGALVASGLLLNTGTAYQPTEKAIKKEIEPVEIETYVVYAYATRPDVPETIGSSRDFCKRLLALTGEGKRWTKDAIDKISNEFGESAWDYRGGFYTNPNTKETTTYCRHLWRSVTKTRKKGGKSANN